MNNESLCPSERDPRLNPYGILILDQNDLTIWFPNVIELIDDCIQGSFAEAFLDERDIPNPLMEAKTWEDLISNETAFSKYVFANALPDSIIKFTKWPEPLVSKEEHWKSFREDFLERLDLPIGDGSISEEHVSEFIKFIMCPSEY